MALKTCHRCNAEQPLAEYYRCPRYRDGFQTWCKTCHREYRADRYRRTREKTLAQNREWAERNPEVARRISTQKSSRRRAKEREAQGFATPQQIAWRSEMYGNRCWMCGGEPTGMDHVIPLSKGGSHWPANLRPACRSCNARKRHFWKGVSQTCQFLTTKSMP